MPGRKLPSTIALDQRVRELHDAIEWLALRGSFYAGFSENDRCVVSV